MRDLDPESAEHVLSGMTVLTLESFAILRKWNSYPSVGTP